MSVLERVFHFHQEILRNRYPNTKTLIGEFEISVATAKRDIAYLRDRLLAPLAVDARKNGFYYTRDDFQLPFTDSPRIVFLLAVLNKLASEAGLGALTELKELQQRLSAMISPRYNSIVDALYCEWIETESIDQEIFATIVDSVGSQRLVEIRYKPIGKPTGTRKVAPQQILNYQGRWYLRGYCTMRREPRLFHLARVRSATLTNEKISPAVPPYEPDHSSFGIFSSKTKYRAEILFTDIAAELVRQQHWHDDQQVRMTDQGLILSLPVGDDRELLMKILQYGARAQVLSPPELAIKLRDEIRKMAENYGFTVQEEDITS